jgi:hypothetical protein
VAEGKPIRDATYLAAGSVSVKTVSDYVPRQYHDRHVAGLTERCLQGEAALRSLLFYIDPDILQRHGNDWLAAVQELLPAPASEQPKPKEEKPMKVSKGRRL